LLGAQLELQLDCRAQQQGASAASGAAARACVEGAGASSGVGVMTTAEVHGPHAPKAVAEGLGA
jgi:hypothetical protein